MAAQPNFCTARQRGVGWPHHTLLAVNSHTHQSNKPGRIHQYSNQPDSATAEGPSQPTTAWPGPCCPLEAGAWQARVHQVHAGETDLDLHLHAGGGAPWRLHRGPGGAPEAGGAGGRGSGSSTPPPPPSTLPPPGGCPPPPHTHRLVVCRLMSSCLHNLPWDCQLATLLLPPISRQLLLLPVLTLLTTAATTHSLAAGPLAPWPPQPRVKSVCRGKVNALTLLPPPLAAHSRCRWRQSTRLRWRR